MFLPKYYEQDKVIYLCYSYKIIHENPEYFPQLYHKICFNKSFSISVDFYVNKRILDMS